MPLPMPLPPELLDWQSRGRRIALAPEGYSLYVQSVGADHAPPARTLLVVHGYPESSFSFARNVPAFTRRFDRVVLVDLLGYGLSDKPRDASYSLFEQADRLLAAWRALGVTGGHLLAHDMGDSVATELVARAVRDLLPPFLTGGFPSLTLTNGSLVMRLAKLRVGQRLLLSPAGPLLARASRYRVFAQQVRSASGGPIGEREIELLWAAVQHEGGSAVQPLLIQYIAERLRFETTRWLPALAATRIPLHVCWGALDRVAPVAIAEHLVAHVCPGATLTVLPNAGHFVQQEDPVAYEAALARFWR